jgi:hypothetical protein
LRASPDGSTSPHSFGDYLCLTDAADIVGTKLVGGWRRSDLEQFERTYEASHDVEAWARADRTRNLMLEALAGGRLEAFGQDQDGAYLKLERHRLSQPFFDIDILRSEFAWLPDEWDVIFVSKVSLNALLNTLSRSGPRKSQRFDWREISSVAWKMALEDSALRRSSALIEAVQDYYHQKHDQHPDDKELRELVRDIIEFLGARTLSRDETK